MEAAAVSKQKPVHRHTRHEHGIGAGPYLLIDRQPEIHHRSREQQQVADDEEPGGPGFRRLL